MRHSKKGFKENQPSEQDLEVTEMLSQSNAIEGVYDSDSLNQAINAWEYLMCEDKLSVGAILKAHKILMLNTSLAPEEKGHFRTIQVYVGRSIPPPSIAVPYMVEQWVEKANLLESPLLDHVSFEHIHPFVDGNGRIGRMLMNWQYARKDQPLTIFTEAHREEYYELFQ